VNDTTVYDAVNRPVTSRALTTNMLSTFAYDAMGRLVRADNGHAQVRRG